MANGSGPPPGAYGGPSGAYAPGATPGFDPYAADRALADWAKQRGYETANTGDPRPHQAWMPFQYLPRFDRIGRELRVAADDVKITIVETFDADPLKQAAGEHVNLLAFVLAPKLTSRVAVRSKSIDGIADGVSRGLSALGGFISSGGQSGPPPGAVLGDPTLEARCDVVAPSRDEGNAALPMPLRHILVAPGFRGAVETRPGGLVMTLHDYKSFDPRTLEALVDLVKQLVTAATPA
jgi:hypothetical protein